MLAVRMGRIIPWATQVLRERRRFRDSASWLTSVRNRVIMLTGRPGPGQKRIVQVRYADLSEPVCVRMGSPDLWVLEEIFSRGEYRRVAEHDLGEVRQIVDLGSNAGMSIRFWLSRWPDARVIGVEPDPHNFEVASLNARQHRGGANVRMVRACVAGEARLVTLDRRKDESKYIMTSVRPSADAIPAWPLTRILEEQGALPVIDLLKVDIEGAEREVFAHCAEWIGRVRHMVLEVHPPYTVEALLADCARNGAEFEVIERHPSPPNEVVFLRAARTPRPLG